jgi:hypothetical protein
MSYLWNDSDTKPVVESLWPVTRRGGDPSCPTWLFVLFVTVILRIWVALSLQMWHLVLQNLGAGSGRILTVSIARHSGENIPAIQLALRCRTHLHTSPDSRLHHLQNADFTPPSSQTRYHLLTRLVVADRQQDMQADRHAGRQADRRTERQADRKTNR